MNPSKWHHIALFSSTDSSETAFNFDFCSSLRKMINVAMCCCSDLAVSPVFDNAFAHTLPIIDDSFASEVSKFPLRHLLPLFERPRFRSDLWLVFVVFAERCIE
jgi:hypothetical protein